MADLIKQAQELAHLWRGGSKMVMPGLLEGLAARIRYLEEENQTLCDVTCDALGQGPLQPVQWCDAIRKMRDELSAWRTSATAASRQAERC